MSFFQPDRLAGARENRVWTFRIALLLPFATLVLLAAGALVTSTGSSLAVPDWPLAYGQVFPPMEGGILFEHGHRMAASLVGFITLALALWIWRVEPRAWVRRLGLAALLLVIAQGVLGGITVLYLLPKPVSISHALTAQLFLLVTVVLAQVNSSRWDFLANSSIRFDRPLHLYGWLTVLALLVQLVLGATTRHNDAGLAIPDFPLAYGALIPPLDDFGIQIHFAHRVGAVVVVLLVLLTAIQTFRTTEENALRVPAAAMVLLVLLQFLLGGLVIWSSKAVFATVIHLVNGAALLGVTGLLAFRASAMRNRGAGEGRIYTVYPLH